MVVDPNALLLQLGAGGLLGFFAGYALKKLLKIVAVFIGLVVLLLAGMSYVGVIEVNWVRLSEMLGVAAESAPSALYNIMGAVVNAVPFAGSFALGFVLGFKKG